MRLHVAGLAHTQTTREWEACAFTSNVRGFCRMMGSLGHEVFLYASEENDAPCAELVTCITTAEQLDLCGVSGPKDVLRARYAADAPHWRLFVGRAAAAVAARRRPSDVLCLSQGLLFAPVAEAFGGPVVEFTAGYEGVLPHSLSHRVFPSHAQAQSIYTYENGGRAQGAPGRLGDRVIPHYFDPADFPFRSEKDGYFLFVGRLNEDKGYRIAIEACRAIGAKLVVAGQGDAMPQDVESRGLVGIEERGELMAGAIATFVPSLYLEPFGKVAVESLLCGTPVITTDWGAFPEINLQGRTGYRCRTPNEFAVAAMRCAAGEINSSACRRSAAERFSEEVVRHQYDRFLRSLRPTG
jgi:glycosyltransferase involved in cell wall biosynthesis